VHERFAEPKGSKGAALDWLFKRILGGTGQEAIGRDYDAVVVFDADTQVDTQFLRIMDARLQAGDQVIQGQHRIRNPDKGWFAALTHAMFLVDNRFQNLGRANLGLSAKHMGDSICIRVDVLRRIGWGEGLTEDYALRQRMLLHGIKIAYEPAAIGAGEAPPSWGAARQQRLRWLRGTHDSSQLYARRVLLEGVRRREPALVDGSLQASLPSYSTLVLLAVAGWLLQICLGRSGQRRRPRVSKLFVGWSLVGTVAFVYPFLGLLLEQAPPRAFLAMLIGPVFIVWRSWLALTARFGMKTVPWVRTTRSAEHGSAPREMVG
jgi:cellulose synthase/poly-beta-1,6-N-acetylglucosamine synthase-like glycosyltransferase